MKWQPRATVTLSNCCRLQKFSRLSVTVLSALILALLFWTMALPPSTRGSKSVSSKYGGDGFRKKLGMLYPGLFAEPVSAQHGSANKCKIPKLNPWDPSIKNFLSAPAPKLQCKHLQHELTYLDDGEQQRILLNETALKLAGYAANDIDCFSRCFDKMNGVDDVTLNESEWTTIKFGSRLEPTCEFIEVSCSRKLSAMLNIYSNLHGRIIKRKQYYDKISTISDNTIGQEQSTPNVLLFVLDSVSNSNFIRYLPKLSAVLNDSDYQSVRMTGFTKIGDNSLPNAAAFLTGKRNCVYGYPDELPCDMSQDFYDHWPFIWKNFSANGYVTHYAEDYPYFNLFQFMSNGFRHKPVDHYFRPFYVKLWDTFLHKRSTHLCYGNNPKHQLQLDYLRRLFEVYDPTTLQDLVHESSENTTAHIRPDSRTLLDFKTAPHFAQSQKAPPIFAFNWLTELAHDWMAQISSGDDDLANFFLRLKPLLLPNTFVFVFSDHGHRFDFIRQTQVGRLEERMPFLSISAPSWFKQRYPDFWAALRTNARRLTTPFDIHATLVHILNLNKKDSDFRYERDFRWGKSLFLPLSENRRCQDAGIPKEFCICEKEVSIEQPQNDEFIVAAANTVISHTNQLLLKSHGLILTEGQLCADLTLNSIVSAQVSLPPTFDEIPGVVSWLWQRAKALWYDYRTDLPSVYFRTTIEAKPSGALLEALVGYWLAENRFTVIGDINRINKYGNQSACIVDSAILKKYCFCVSK